MDYEFAIRAVGSALFASVFAARANYTIWQAGKAGTFIPTGSEMATGNDKSCAAVFIGLIGSAVIFPSWWLILSLVAGHFIGSRTALVLERRWHGRIAFPFAAMALSQISKEVPASERRESIEAAFPGWWVHLMGRRWRNKFNQLVEGCLAAPDVEAGAAPDHA